MSENESIQTRRPDGTHRVVITGVGAVTPAGVGAEALWETLMERGCCIAPIERFDTSEYEVHIAGEVRDFDGTEHGLTKKEARRFERFVQYAIVAADEALAQSGLEVTDENRDRIAVVFGTGIGGIDELQKSFATLEEKGPKRVNPLFIPTMIGNIAAGNLAIRYGMRGECLNVVTACATGAHCIGTALRDIRHGYIDAALVGGTEESVSPICIAGFTNLSALTRAEDPKEASLPFDARRGGFVAGEGAGALVIESLESALARGAAPIAEITGFGSTGDAYHMTAPDPEATAITAAMAAALAEGGFTPADLGHLNAHGTGTPANDATESKALANLMGGVEAAASVPVTSVKGTTGHMLGAAGLEEVFHAQVKVRVLTGVQGDEGHVDVLVPQKLQLLLVQLAHLVVLKARGAVPHPAVQVPGVVDALALALHQKGHAHVGGAQGGHLEGAHLAEGTGPHKGGLVPQLLRHLPGGDVVGEQVVHLPFLPGQLENGGGEVVRVAVAGKDVQGLAHLGDVPLVVVEQQAAMVQLHKVGAVVDKGNFHRGTSQKM